VIVYNARDVGKVRSAVALAYAAADEGCYSNIRRTRVVIIPIVVTTATVNCHFVTTASYTLL